MTIEVRQLTIRSRVGEGSGPTAEHDAVDGESGTPVDEERVRHLLRESLEELRRWLEKRLTDERGR